MIELSMALAATLLIAGCSTQLTDNQVEAMHAPTLTLDCTTGCSASYTDPRDRPKLPTNGWDTANNAINAVAGVATSVAPWAAIGITASQGIKSAMGDDNSDNSRSADSRDSSVRTDNRDSSVRTDNRDSSVRIDNRVDSTHAPTVVTQPEPVIVTQPSPVVVQQSDPIINQ